jgi:chromosome partitioning protein
MVNVPGTAALEPALMKNGTKEGFNVLRKGLRNYALEHFDITLIDKPPNMGIVVINSVHCSDFAIVPTEAGSTHSIRALIKAVQFIQDIGSDPEGNAGLRFLGLLLKKVDRRSSVRWIITEQLKAQFGEHMFEIPIPMNTSIQRAELMVQTIFTYDSNSVAAEAYQELARELISILEKQK